MNKSEAHMKQIQKLKKEVKALDLRPTNIKQSKLPKFQNFDDTKAIQKIDTHIIPNSQNDNNKAENFLPFLSNKMQDPSLVDMTQLNLDFVYINNDKDNVTLDFLLNKLDSNNTISDDNNFKYGNQQSNQNKEKFVNNVKPKKLQYTDPQNNEQELILNKKQSKIKDSNVLPKKTNELWTTPQVMNISIDEMRSIWNDIKSNSFMKKNKDVQDLDKNSKQNMFYRKQCQLDKINKFV